MRDGRGYGCSCHASRRRQRPRRPRRGLVVAGVRHGRAAPRRSRAGRSGRGPGGLRRSCESGVPGVPARRRGGRGVRSTHPSPSDVERERATSSSSDRSAKRAHARGTTAHAARACPRVPRLRELAHAAGSRRRGRSDARIRPVPSAHAASAGGRAARCRPARAPCADVRSATGTSHRRWIGGRHRPAAPHAHARARATPAPTATPPPVPTPDGPTAIRECGTLAPADARDAAVFDRLWHQERNGPGWTGGDDCSPSRWTTDGSHGCSGTASSAVCSPTAPAAPIGGWCATPSTSQDGGCLTTVDRGHRASAHRAAATVGRGSLVPAQDATVDQQLLHVVALRVIRTGLTAWDFSSSAWTSWTSTCVPVTVDAVRTRWSVERLRAVGRRPCWRPALRPYVYGVEDTAHGARVYLARAG